MAESCRLGRPLHILGTTLCSIPPSHESPFIHSVRKLGKTLCKAATFTKAEDITYDILKSWYNAYVSKFFVPNLAVASCDPVFCLSAPLNWDGRLWVHHHLPLLLFFFFRIILLCSLAFLYAFLPHLLIRTPIWLNLGILHYSLLHLALGLLRMAGIDRPLSAEKKTRLQSKSCPPHFSSGLDWWSRRFPAACFVAGLLARRGGWEPELCPSA